MFIDLIIFAIVSIVISAISYGITAAMAERPETQSQKPPSTGEFNFPTASEGRVIPVLFGTTRIKGVNVTWYGDFAYEPVRQRIKGADNYTAAYNYYFGMDIALCHGPIDGISEIKLGDKVSLVEVGEGYVSSVGTPTGYAFHVDNVAPVSQKNELDLIDGTFTFYAGTNDQNSDSYMASVVDRSSVNSIVLQFSIEEETTGNYWIRNTATKKKFGSQLEIATELKAQVGDEVQFGTVNRYVNNVPTTPGPAYNNLKGVIAQIDAATGDIRVEAGSGIADQVDLDGGIIYVGSTEQWAAGIISNYQIVPSYKGVAHLVWSSDDRVSGGQFGQSTNIPALDVVAHRYPRPAAILSGSGDIAVLAVDAFGRGDANPVYCLYDLLTNETWGAGIPEKHLNTASFRSAAETVYQEGLGFSMLLDNDRDASSVSSDMLSFMGGILHQDFNGQLTLTLNRKATEEQIEASQVLDPTNVTELISYQKQSWEETSNSVRLEYTDRLRNYKDASAFAIDQGNVAMLGKEQNTKLRMPGCATSEVASRLAQRSLQNQSYPLTTVSVKANRSMDPVFPGDIMRFSWPDLNMDEVVFRVTGVDEGSQSAPERNITMVEDLFQYAGQASFVSGPDDGINQLPGDIVPPNPRVYGIFAVPPALAWERYKFSNSAYNPADGFWSSADPVPEGWVASTLDPTLLHRKADVPIGVGIIGIPDPEDNHPTLENPPQLTAVEIDYTNDSTFVDAGTFTTPPNSLHGSRDMWVNSEQQEVAAEHGVNWADPESSFDAADCNEGVTSGEWAGGWSAGVYPLANTVDYIWRGSIVFDQQRLVGNASILNDVQSLTDMGANGAGIYMITSKNAPGNRTSEFIAIEEVRTTGHAYAGSGISYTNNLFNIHRGLFGTNPQNHSKDDSILISLDESEYPAQIYTADASEWDEGVDSKVNFKSVSSFGESPSVSRTLEHEKALSMSTAAPVQGIYLRPAQNINYLYKNALRMRDNPAKWGVPLTNYKGSDAPVSNSNVSQPFGDFNFWDDINHAVYPGGVVNNLSDNAYQVTAIPDDYYGLNVSWRNMSPQDGFLLPYDDVLGSPAQGFASAVVVYFHVHAGRWDGSVRQLAGSSNYYVNPETKATSTGDIASANNGCIWYANAPAGGGNPSPFRAGDLTPRGVTQLTIPIEKLLEGDAVTDLNAVWRADSHQTIGTKSGYCVSMWMRAYNPYVKGTSGGAHGFYQYPRRKLFIESAAS